MSSSRAALAALSRPVGSKLLHLSLGRASLGGSSWSPDAEPAVGSPERSGGDSVPLPRLIPKSQDIVTDEEKRHLVQCSSSGHSARANMTTRETERRTAHARTSGCPILKLNVFKETISEPMERVVFFFFSPLDNYFFTVKLYRRSYEPRDTVSVAQIPREHHSLPMETLMFNIQCCFYEIT